MLREWLQTTIAAIRGFAKVQSPDSLNQPMDAEQHTERIDILADPHPLPMEHLEYQGPTPGTSTGFFPIDSTVAISCPTKDAYETS